MDILTSVQSLQNQFAYQIGVHVKMKSKLFTISNKTFYEAEWIHEKPSPLTLIEMKGNGMINEILTNVSLNHPHIIKTYGLVEPTDQMRMTHSILVLQEFAREGNLAELLQRNMFRPNINIINEIIIQITGAMIYLSKEKIVHGDLACRNVLVFKTDATHPDKNLVKLIDFGFNTTYLKEFRCTVYLSFTLCCSRDHHQ